LPLPLREFAEREAQHSYKYRDATNHKKDRNHQEKRKKEKRERNATLIRMRREEYHPEIQFWFTVIPQQVASTQLAPKIFQEF
jgi:hypothetical protein